MLNFIYIIFILNIKYYMLYINILQINRLVSIRYEPPLKDIFAQITVHVQN